MSNSFTVLLDDSLKENQSLREQLRQRDEENAVKFEELSNKADSLCKLVAENNSDSRKRNQRKVTQRSMYLQAVRNEFVPFVFSISRFQGPAFHCDEIVVILTLVRCIAGSVGLMFAILRILRKARGNGGYSMFRETYLRATTYE